MVNLKAVPDSKTEGDPQKERRTSTLVAPYYDLNDSVLVAKAIYEKAGGSCTREWLAPTLNYKGVKNGSFVTRVTAAKAFGLIDQQDDKLSVTPRGQSIVAPITPAAAETALVDAFLGVPLFKRVYEKYRTGELPQEVGLRNLFLTEMGVLKERVAPSVRVFMESADQAGFFRTAGTRRSLVRPHIASGSSHQPSADPKPNADQASGQSADTGRSDADRQQRNGGSGGNGDDTGAKIHPAIKGLLQNLPSTDTPLTDKRRAAIVAAFKAAVDLAYGEAE